MYFLLLRRLRSSRRDLSPTEIRARLDGFEAVRQQTLATPEAANPAALEYTALSEGESNAAWNLRRRLEILEEAIGR